MTVKITLLTGIKDIDNLNEIANSDLKKVRIDADVLKRLLIDHSVMFKALKGNTLIKVKEPE